MKSYKPLTPKQEGNIWAEIEVQALKAYQEGACDGNLLALNDALFELNKLSKRLQKSNVGKIIERHVTDVIQSKPVIRKIKIT